MSEKQTKLQPGKQRLALLPPDNGGWYTTGKPDWIDLAPIRDSSCRAWHIMRSLVMEKSPNGAVRNLTIDELCKMVPLIAADGSVKPSSLGRMRDIFRELSAIGLISDPQGNPITTSSSAKAALQTLSIRINDWPADGVDYDGWRNAYAKLDAIRAGQPFDKPKEQSGKRKPPSAPTRKPRKKAAKPDPTTPQQPSVETPAGSDRVPAVPAGQPRPPGWKSNQGDGAGWISNQSGWNLNRSGWISNHDSASDLGERNPSLIPSPSIPLSSAPSAPSDPLEQAEVGTEKKKIDSENGNDGQAAPSVPPLPAPRVEQSAASAPAPELVCEIDGPAAERAVAVERIVSAWTTARDVAGFGPHRRGSALADFTASATALVGSGRSVEWLVAVATWMGTKQPAWVGLGEATRAQYAGAPEEPKVRPVPQLTPGQCPRHPVMPKDCSSCRREEMEARRDSEPDGLDIAGVLADLGVKL